jgi:DNA-binding NarL/FixJ family response regulator
MDARLGFVGDDDSSIGEDPTHPGQGLVTAEEWPAIAEVLNLTIREWEVVVMLFRGRSRLAVARKLGISARTVRHYLEQIHIKLRVQDRIELVLKIVEVRDQLRAADGDN